MNRLIEKTSFHDMTTYSALEEGVIVEGPLGVSSESDRPGTIETKEAKVVFCIASQQPGLKKRRGDEIARAKRRGSQRARAS